MTEAGDSNVNLTGYFARQHKETRIESHLQRLGSPTPACCLCGYAAPEGLVRASKALVEKHHLMGRHEGPYVYLCRNHHGELSNVQFDHDRRLESADRDEKTRLAALLQGLADFFEWLAKEFRYKAAQILGWEIKGMDAD